MIGLNHLIPALVVLNAAGCGATTTWSYHDVELRVLDGESKRPVHGAVVDVFYSASWISPPVPGSSGSPSRVNDMDGIARTRIADFRREGL